MFASSNDATFTHSIQHTCHGTKSRIPPLLTEDTHPDKVENCCVEGIKFGPHRRDQRAQRRQPLSRYIFNGERKYYTTGEEGMAYVWTQLRFGQQVHLMTNKAWREKIRSVVVWNLDHCCIRTQVYQMCFHRFCFSVSILSGTIVFYRLLKCFLTIHETVFYRFFLLQLAYILELNSVFPRKRKWRNGNYWRCLSREIFSGKWYSTLLSNTVKLSQVCTPVTVYQWLMQDFLHRRTSDPKHPWSPSWANHMGINHKAVPYKDVDKRHSQSILPS